MWSNEYRISWKKQVLRSFLRMIIGYRLINFLRNKSDVQRKTENFCNEIKTCFSGNIKELTYHFTNGDREYVNKDILDFLEKLGIRHTSYHSVYARAK